MWQNGEVSVINIVTNTVSMFTFILPLNVIEVVKKSMGLQNRGKKELNTYADESFAKSMVIIREIILETKNRRYRFQNQVFAFLQSFVPTNPKL